MSEKNKTYTAADFAAYHSGKMPEAEMYALEKAALEDPFLADALDGYAFTATAENDIAEIKVRLKDKNKSAKVFFLSSSNKRWWRAAAAVIIIAGAGILFFNINKKVTDTTLAQTEIKPSVKEVPSSTSDTIIKEEEKKDTDKINNGVQSNGLVKNEDAIKKEKIQTIIAPTQTASAPVADIMEDKAAKYYNTSVEKSAKAKEYTLKGKVTDDNGAPVIVAVVENKKNRSAVLTDSTGSFALRSDDSSINATASALGYDSKNISLSKDKATPVELNKNSADLQAVVVTGYGTQKKSTVTGSSVRRMDSEASPATGTEKYDSYVAENIQRFYDSSATRPTGTVVLSFELSKKGHPKNIFVVSSSCPECNAAAIKILKDGPAWIGKKGQRQTKSFTF